ncbi:DinB family protein [Planctobacterium marinum]|uniref:Damage-inducible protein DinB n=1 Tax=Planctobacterium marinum TaxID=1631968 RepID=A0AA48HJU7_9ALTE|nr:damage-inducible protein DinB [Planctobacterium marinum]
MLSCFEYKQWADKRTIEAIKLLALEKKDSSAFCLQQLNHMTIVEELFISRIEQRQAPHESTNTVTIPLIEELQERNNRNNLWLQEYLKNNSEVQLQTPISFVFTDGKSGRLTVQEILMHLLTHSSYHRGSIAHALDLAGTAHPVDGLAMYLHQAQPDRREPAEN